LKIIIFALSTVISEIFTGYMKDLFRDFLSLSALERKGVMFLILIIFMSIGINVFLKHRPISPKNEINNSLLEEFRSFEQQLTVIGDSSVNRYAAVNESINEPPVLFYFDPNEVSAGDLRRLGMSNRQARTLINYRLHGGKFQQKEDLKKIYGLSAVFCERLMPYVRIKEYPVPRIELAISAPLNAGTPVNLNLADSAALEKLRGIGPVLAKRIVLYRSLLGGYCHTSQLKEVYGISDSLFLAINTRVFADTTVIRKLDLNHITESELARHPYIGRYTARGIILYRSKVQKINCLDELRVNGLIPAENLEKLKKYLMI